MVIQDETPISCPSRRVARSELARLNLRAPFAGRWMDMNPDWRAGQWIGSQEPLGVLVDPQGWVVDAYVEQDQVHRLQEGRAAAFYPVGSVERLTGRVVAIGSTRVSQLEHPMLASRHGGPLGVATKEDGLVPNPPLFHVLVRLDEPPPSLSETRGRVQIEGARRSLLAEGARRLFVVLLRESSF